MKHLLSFLALWSVVSAGPVAAQADGPRLSNPQQSVPFEWRRDYHAYCRDDRASAPLPPEPGMRATFGPGEDRDDEGAPEVLAICMDSLRAAYASHVTSTHSALVLLAHRPMEPLWPAMETAWGNDLSRLRERILSNAGRNRGTTWSSQLEPLARNAIARAEDLRMIGEYDEAVAVLEQAAARLAERRYRRSHYDFDRGLVHGYMAGTLSIRDGDLAAAAYLERVMAAEDDDNEYALNTLINRAAYLAEGGEHLAAYRLIAPAYAEFRGAPISDRTYQTGGADREFAWILGCAKWHLDGPDAAAPYIAMVEEAPEQPVDEYRISVRRSTEIERRMYRCMNNADGYFRQFANASLHPHNVAWLYLQPVSGSEGLPADWTVPASVAQLYETRYRVLPERYWPALRDWQPAADGAAGTQ